MGLPLSRDSTRRTVSHQKTENDIEHTDKMTGFGQIQVEIPFQTYGQTGNSSEMCSCVTS